MLKGQAWIRFDDLHKMQLIDSFNTDRLHLRLPQLGDAKSIFDAYARDAAVCRYLTWLPYTELEACEAWLAEKIDSIGKTAVVLLLTFSRLILQHFANSCSRSFLKRGIMLVELIYKRGMCLGYCTALWIWPVPPAIQDRKQDFFCCSFTVHVKKLTDMARICHY